MKSITEFAFPVLTKFANAKKALLTEGKTAEEVATTLGETFKFEAEKLKYIMAASDLIEGKTAVKRVLVATFAEGETAPASYQKVEETHYLVENIVLTPFVKAAPVKAGRGGGKVGPGGKGGDRPKTSPWGASPDEIEAKKKASIAAALAKKK